MLQKWEDELMGKWEDGEMCLILKLVYTKIKINDMQE
jgi:hypothetical protein